MELVTALSESSVKMQENADDKNTTSSRIDAVQSIVEESLRTNHSDIQWMCQELEHRRREKAPFLSDSNLIDLTRHKIEKDRAAVAVAKEYWLENSERKLHWLNLRKLTNHYDSAIQMLDNRELLSFPIFSPVPSLDKDLNYPLANLGYCFENARISRVFTVYKVLLMYAIRVILAMNGDEIDEKKEEENTLLIQPRFYQKVLQNTRFVYPITVPFVLDDLLANCYLYHRFGARSCMLIPNAGYVFGGEVQDIAPYNRGLDCTSFIGWISGCGRPLTYLYELAWKTKLGEDVEVKNQEDQEMVDMLCERHDVIQDFSQVQAGDILIWRHVVGGGHAMLVQKVVTPGETIMSVECTNYKDGHYEGFEERVVTIRNPNPGGREGVLRPKNQSCYLGFRERCQGRILLRREHYDESSGGESAP